MLAAPNCDAAANCVAEGRGCVVVDKTAVGEVHVVYGSALPAVENSQAAAGDPRQVASEGAAIELQCRGAKPTNKAICLTPGGAYSAM